LFSGGKKKRENQKRSPAEFGTGKKKKRKEREVSKPLVIHSCGERIELKRREGAV